MEKLTGLRPGMSVNIVTYVDVDKEIIDVKNALVYDANTAEIILSQTTPLISDDDIGKEITITYLTDQNASLTRVGFVGKVVNILSDYNLDASKTVQAIRVIKESDFISFDLRMHYRVKPKLNSDIYLSVAHEKVNLMDISLGGALFSHSKIRPIKPATYLNIILTIDGQEFSIEGKSVNTWHYAKSERSADLEYVSVQFLELDKRCSHALSGKILSIQRELLSKI